MAGQSAHHCHRVTLTESSLNSDLIKVYRKDSFIGYIIRNEQSRLSNHLHGHFLLCYSIHRNPNNVWNNKTHLSVAKTRFVLVMFLGHFTFGIHKYHINCITQSEKYHLV